MTDDQKPTTLTELLDQIREAIQGCDRVTVGTILRIVGRRSFGPLLLVAGLITLAPVIGDIPGVPTIIGVLVLLIAIQLLFHREHVWLPRWLLTRSVARDKANKVLGWMHRPAKFVDRLLRPRLRMFTDGAAYHIIVIICVLIATLMPAMEVVPFSANAAGAALTALGLALIARDGLLALIAMAIAAGIAGFLVYYLL